MTKIFSPFVNCSERAPLGLRQSDNCSLCRVRRIPLVSLVGKYSLPVLLHHAGMTPLRRRRCETFWNRTIDSLRSALSPAAGSGRVGGALNTIAWYESMHMIRKGQIRWLAKDDVIRQIRFIHQGYGIAA